jgi:membrane dipeptidase
VPLAYVDHRADPAGWARELGVSREACELLLDAHFVDLHCDLEVPVRLLGYDPAKRHGPWRRPVPFFGHTDYPRLREASLTGVCYDLATNVFRREASRLRITVDNLERCKRQIAAFPEDLGLARTRADYDALHAAGRTAMFLCLQGGNALSADPSVLGGEVGRDLHRITLVHLSSSVLGGSNSPSQPDRGVTDRGRAFVEACVAARVIVDLAHAGPRTFAGALEVHPRDVPPIVSHTAMAAVRPHWRNTSDEQARQIAERGGVIGIVYQGNFLTDVLPGCPATRADLVRHLEHAVTVAGEDHVAIGTDYDGVITPPRDLADVTHHPKLVQDLLDRRWPEARIRKVLGLNYLRVVADVRG